MFVATKVKAFVAKGKESEKKIFLDQCTVKFCEANGNIEIVKAHWCNICKNNQKFVVRSWKQKVFHIGSNLSCQQHIYGHYKVYKNKCKELGLQEYHHVIPCDIVKAQKSKEYSRENILQAVAKFIVCDDQAKMQSIDQTKAAFLGLTAYWIEVIASRGISETHSGHNLAWYLVDLCEHTGIMTVHSSKTIPATTQYVTTLKHYYCRDTHVLQIKAISCDCHTKLKVSKHLKSFTADTNITWLGNTSATARDKVILDPWVVLIKPSVRYILDHWVHQQAPSGGVEAISEVSQVTPIFESSKLRHVWSHLDVVEVIIHIANIKTTTAI
ncbi:hypothetical protein BDR05DRAFT_944509 [Suillus weaverae]|nr:hypothetical protein BDR05DRAFT_944509 [Suillus weaverae]